MTSKIDYPPLLGHGVHPFTPFQLRQLTVEAFPDSRRRPSLLKNFFAYLDRLSATGLIFEVLIGGSFVCRKPSPNDVDLIIIYDADSVRRLSTKEKSLVAPLLHPKYVLNEYQLDVRGVRSSDDDGITYWLNKFGTQRDDTTPQGLVSVRLKP